MVPFIIHIENVSKDFFSVIFLGRNTFEYCKGYGVIIEFLISISLTEKKISFNSASTRMISHYHAWI